VRHHTINDFFEVFFSLILWYGRITWTTIYIDRLLMSGCIYWHANPPYAGAYVDVLDIRNRQRFVIPAEIISQTPAVIEHRQHFGIVQLKAIRRYVSCKQNQLAYAPIVGQIGVATFVDGAKCFANNKPAHRMGYNVNIDWAIF